YASSPLHFSDEEPAYSHVNFQG
ncbi:hypothetical protein BVRB_015920, partial [Beta vulgaris subsp. vulgaris]